MKIVHFSDLHLDTPFSWAGASGDVARRRREALRTTLLNIIELTREVDADALFCGGDLYEHDRFTPDTAEFLRSSFASLGSTPVFIAPGNHDRFDSQSIYALNRWSDNVHVFREPRLEPVQLDDGLTLWGAGHRVPANTPGFLDDFKASGDSIHIALFHGSEQTWWSEQEDGKKQPHAPFEAEQVPASGLSHVFLGHYHRPRDAEYHTYPGNPDPLEFGEDGERGAVVATINSDGSVVRQRHQVAVTRIHDLLLDVTGATNRGDIRDRVLALTDGLEGLARVTVHGEMDPSVELHTKDLHDLLGASFEAHQVRIGEIHTAYDIDVIRQEPTVKGTFVSDVLAAGLPADTERRVLVTGLRAFDGRTDLEVV